MKIKRVWLSRNTKEIVINQEKNKEEETQSNIDSRINHHIEVSIRKIEEINNFWFNFQTKFENKWEFKKIF